MTIHTVNKVHKISWVTWLALLVFPVMTLAQESQVSNEAAAQQLSAILHDTRSLQADVEQLTIDQDGREIQEFQARLLLQKPDHFSWEILSPYSELLLTDGSTIWRHEPDLEQVTIQPFENDVSRTPVLLLNGDAEEIAASYTISSTDMEFGSKQRFVLLPRSPDSLFERLSLTFAGNQLEEMQFEDSLGQKTSLFFTALATNETIDPEAFVFQMPQGVEVIDNTGE